MWCFPVRFLALCLPPGLQPGPAHQQHLHLPCGIKAHLASAEGRMKAQPSDLLRALLPSQGRAVGALWPCGEGRSPLCCLWGSPGSWGRAGADCTLSLLTSLSLSAQAAPTSPHDGFSTAPSTNCFIRHAWLPSSKIPKPWRVTPGAEAVEHD